MYVCPERAAWSLACPLLLSLVWCGLVFEDELACGVMLRATRMNRLVERCLAQKAVEDVERIARSALTTRAAGARICHGRPSGVPETL